MSKKYMQRCPTSLVIKTYILKQRHTFYINKSINIMSTVSDNVEKKITLILGRGKGKWV